MFDSHAHYSLELNLSESLKPRLEICVDPYYFSQYSFSSPHLGVGWHPLYLPALNYFNDSMSFLERLISNHDVSVLGEIGFDNRLKNDQLQSKYFEAQWVLAYSLNMPVSVHLVKSTQCFQRALNLLPSHRFVMHGFSGNLELAEWVVKNGGLIGVGPQLLNPKNHKLRRVVNGVSIASLVIETDWPFVGGLKDQYSPTTLLFKLTEEIARIKTLSFKEADKILTHNALQFIGSNHV